MESVPSEQGEQDVHGGASTRGRRAGVARVHSLRGGPGAGNYIPQPACVWTFLHPLISAPPSPQYSRAVLNHSHADKGLSGRGCRPHAQHSDGHVERVSRCAPLSWPCPLPCHRLHTSSRLQPDEQPFYSSMSSFLPLMRRQLRFWVWVWLSSPRQRQARSRSSRRPR